MVNTILLVLHCHTNADTSDAEQIISFIVMLFALAGKSHVKDVNQSALIIIPCIFQVGRLSIVKLRSGLQLLLCYLSNAPCRTTGREPT